MKFVVRKSGLDYVDVKLHSDTKEQIRKIFYFGALVVAGGIAGQVYTNTHSKKNQE